MKQIGFYSDKEWIGIVFFTTWFINRLFFVLSQLPDYIWVILKKIVEIWVKFQFLEK